MITHFTHRAAIDVGDVHAIAAVEETGENLIITGQKLCSIYRLYNKKLGELQRKMSHCKNESKALELVFWKRVYDLFEV